MACSYEAVGLSGVQLGAVELSGVQLRSREVKAQWSELAAELCGGGVRFEELVSEHAEEMGAGGGGRREMTTHTSVHMCTNAGEAGAGSGGG